MTVFRALKKVGYYTSYNHNAAYYTLADVPEFDDWGLWAYRNVRFSRAGTLLETLVALVARAPAGLTVGELEERLQTPVANLLSRLVQHGQLQRQVLRGRHVVYLSSEAEPGRRQWEQRQQDLRAVAVREAQGFPAGCSALQVIEVLRQMLESGWGGLKRGRRRTHGRAKLTRDFQSLPEEYLLIPNLENETYLQVVLGGSLAHV
jgi:hypothetical protein